MLKKFFTYPVFLVLVLSVISLILFGALVKYDLEGGQRFQTLRGTAAFLSGIPQNIKKMIKNKRVRFDASPSLKKNINKKRFEQFIPNKRNALLVLPRYNHSISRSVVDIVDLNNFEVIHTYQHDIAEMNNQVQNFEEFPNLNKDIAANRFYYNHPLILKDGSLVSEGNETFAFKIDFCSNLIWINDQESFHHSKMLDHEGYIWSPGRLNPYPTYVKKYFQLMDDSIIKINTDGKIIFNKSVMEILIENKIIDTNTFNNKLDDPIHLNDIEPALNDTKYWKKGDVFLSIRTQSAIIHYRPGNNKVLNYMKGPFFEQHDVDIISENEISIFNNNNTVIDNEYSEILIYNFETKNFRKLFNDQLKKENFKTIHEGLSHIFNDGALMVEEQNHGRIILFNNKGEKEWEFVNKDKNGNIGTVNWSRIIEDELFIEKFKSLVENKKCTN